MNFRRLSMLAAAAALLAGCGESDSTAPAPSADEAPGTMEADPHTVGPSGPGEATDAPMPEPVDDKGERLYRKGLYKEAIAHWTKAAAEGDAYANYRLGVEYLDAKVVERDVEKAAAYQKRAAELGDPRGMFELATLYEYGQGVEQSDKLAAKYYLMAAERGLPEAQHNIATMFEMGTGVEKDLVQAYKFYALARAQGFDVAGFMGGGGNAPDPLKALEEVMTEEQLVEARRQVAEFEAGE
ncbi:MAG: tetratricopeptide repeat protein [Alphaproteobacteria bacterium]